MLYTQEKEERERKKINDIIQRVQWRANRRKEEIDFSNININIHVDRSNDR